MKTKLNLLIKKIIIIPIQNLVKIDVLILCNLGNREMLGQLLVGNILRQKYGLKVKIQTHAVLRDLWLYFFRPSVVVSLWINSDVSIKRYNQIKSLGATAIVSPTEVFAPLGVNKFLMTQNFKHLVEVLLLPGAGMKQMLVKHKKVSSNKAKVIGYSTFDWTKSPYKHLFMSKTEFIKKMHIGVDKKIIFLATSFTFADININEWDKKYYFWPFTKKEAYKRIQLTLAIREKTVTALSQLLDNHPNWHLIVKKHPMEISGYYHKHFGGNQQVSIVENIDIHDLLVNCDALIHWNSTSSIQAWSLNKPILRLNFKECRILDKFNINLEELKYYLAGNFNVDTKEELEKLLEMVFSKRITKVELDKQNKAMKKYIKQWFYKIDGKTSYRAAKIIYNSCYRAKDRPIKYLFDINDLIILLPMYLKYKFAWWSYMLSGQLERIDMISNPVDQYDNFYLERNKRRFESKLKSIIKETN
jgi:surface carbohydrate biosynthesis protein